MKRFLAHAAATLGVIGAPIALDSADRANAIGVFYADPGWAYSYDGDEAFYNDPDGPNPDYVNGDDQNQPGGRGGTAALVDPGIVCDPGCHVNNDAAEWIHQGQQWEGSAPGDALGGIPGSPPPLPPPAPGGVAAYSDAGTGTTFLRIQDPGLPGATTWGWGDKNSQAIVNVTARQEGNNRRMLFGHDIAKDPEFNGSTAVLDNGITISFRARLATRATGHPLDDVFIEGGSGPGDIIPWPDDGLGYEVSNNGRGMFMLTQTRPAGGFNQMAFSLLDDNTVDMEELGVNVGMKRGLAMNNRSNPLQSVNTNDATPATANVFEIPHDELDEWQEFWITIVQLAEPADGNTHEINVYHNGSLTPETFQTFLAPENEFDGSAFLGMGLSSDSRQGAFDVDFITYKEGVIVPTLASVLLAGDFNDDGNVDAADYVVWRDKLGSSFALPNETVTPGMVTPEDYDAWKANFGAAAASGSVAPQLVPEPCTSALLFLAMLAASRRILRRK